MTARVCWKQQVGREMEKTTETEKYGKGQEIGKAGIV